MSYVFAAYIAVFGVLIVYGGRIVIRSRSIAAKVLAQQSGSVPEADEP